MERESNDNSNERMADRPRPDEERIDETLSVDDVTSVDSESPPINDV